MKLNWSVHIPASSLRSNLSPNQPLFPTTFHPLNFKQNNTQYSIAFFTNSHKPPTPLCPFTCLINQPTLSEGPNFHIFCSQNTLNDLMSGVVFHFETCDVVRWARASLDFESVQSDPAAPFQRAKTTARNHH